MSEVDSVDDGQTGSSDDIQEPRASWGARNWSWVVAGLVGFIVGAAVMGLIGGSSNPGASVADVTDAPSTSQVDVGDEHGEEEVDEPEPPASEEKWESKKYTGNGGKNFGKIVVPEDAVLKWKCDGCGDDSEFYLSSDYNDDGNMIDIDQTGTSGESFVEAGTYHNVKSIGSPPFTFWFVASDE